MADTNIKLLLGPKNRAGVFKSALSGKTAEQLYFLKGKTGFFSLTEKLYPVSGFFLFGTGQQEKHQSEYH
jgi:hypothetical protein